MDCVVIHANVTRSRKNPTIDMGGLCNLCEDRFDGTEITECRQIITRLLPE